MTEGLEIWVIQGIQRDYSVEEWPECEEDGVLGFGLTGSCAWADWWADDQPPAKLRTFRKKWEGHGFKAVKGRWTPA